jgi:hypothetical protein
MEEKDTRMTRRVLSYAQPAAKRRKSSGARSASLVFLASLGFGVITLVLGYSGAALAGAGHGDYTVLRIAGVSAAITAVLFVVSLLLFLVNLFEKWS